MSLNSLHDGATAELSQAEWLQERLASLISMAQSLGAAREQAEPARRDMLEETLRLLGPQIQHTREQLAALGIEATL